MRIFLQCLSVASTTLLTLFIAGMLLTATALADPGEPDPGAVNCTNCCTCSATTGCSGPTPSQGCTNFNCNTCSCYMNNGNPVCLKN